MPQRGSLQIKGRGTDKYHITEEDAHRNFPETKKTAVVENEDAKEDEPKRAFFDIRGAGNWVEGIRLVNSQA